ncbi:alpha-mannosidase [Mycolicibacterium arabiense]|uniref:Alpha-mannosidase n=1 Tax=Mycolicibacterium arabiense TaxID=1286181 RepID=A0A7I7RZJ4_9MYCO|nr:NEW3 domain-containing protein [Mycolicibacterium arabiense]MCV7374112.1 alpha-mannosidase [Mycolicibacterium arabiense]BBY49359.1 alpha-mannosidase [Mycolicibacterium arabiense]
MAVVPEVSAESTDLFVGPEDALRQVVRVHLPPGSAAAAVRIDGDGLTCDDVPAQPGTEIVEVAVTVTDPMPGRSREARVVVGDASVPFTFVDAEPGWTMYMISHFHYDPVWWNTQAAYTSTWTEDPPGRCRQTNGFDLVAAHLDMARREPEYKFVLAEVDYLKPYWDARPEDRAELRRMIADGRVEVMGGTYNEPNTNLTSPETTIRNFVHGIGFQRDVMGANPATAWQLDVFGHDPQFPGMAADAGLTSSSWARGPHHQWGPMAGDGDPERMQFASEFEWLAPSGRGLLTHYMPAHYAAGWWMDSSPTLAEAEDATYALFAGLKKVALTRNVLLPVGTDYTPPNKWVTEIHRDWNARYTWPRFVCALPSEFFSAVRAEVDERGAAPAPQTRDMNPIYTGKDVSYVDTKQANRAAEHAVLQAERFAVFAGLIAGAAYPHSALAKAWVQLAYGAHHDAITGSESDQVYLDLLTSWRDAWDLGRTVRDSAIDVLTGAVEGDVVVWNPLAHNRTDVVTVHLHEPMTGTIVDTNGAELPTLIEHGGHTVSWLAHDVPSMGWRAHRTSKGAPTAWETMPGNEIQNAHHRIRVDAARGGGVTSWTAAGRQLIAEGRVGNELAVYDEYPAHPEAGEGPWHLLPKGPLRTSSEDTADVRAERCALGERLTIDGRIDGVLRYTQTITLWRGVDRVDCRTVIDEFTGQDALLRLRWPCPVPGAMPVSEVGDAVIGRGFGLMHEPGDHAHAVDSARHPHTLDNPAYGWFGLSSAVRIRVCGAGPGGDEADGVRAISVAEIVTAVGAEASPAVRDLSVALVRAGVTTTCSHAGKPRYGDLTVDSNLPDARIALGGPEVNAFTAALLAAAEPAYAAELRRQLDDSGVARVWVPASRALAERWVPGADLRDVRALPVLVLAAEAGIESIVAAVVDDLADAEIAVSQQTPHDIGEFDARTVAVMNRGVPSFAVDSDGTLHTSLMRSCTGWPSGTWIDAPRRTVPDGSNFQLQHWTHDFDYALVASVGDWRDAGLPARSAEYSQPLLGVVSRHRGHAGGLPAWGSMLEIEPAGQVALAACKVAGNAIAHGTSRHVEPEDGITLRLVETHGRSTEVSLRSGLRSVSAAQRVDLLESPLTNADGAALHGYEIATIHAELNLPRLDGAGPVGLVTDAEAAQPLYARYWLHNRGPAPMGGLPAVAHLEPQRVTAAPGSTVALRLTAASDCTDATLHGHVRLVCPAGVSATPDELPFLLPPGEYLKTAVSIDIPAGTAPGRYPVRAELAVTGHSDIPPSWRQLVEDVCWITVGDGTDDVLRLVGGPEPIDVPAGGSATLSVTVGTDAKADLSIEAHLISPWGTWEWVGPSAVGADLPAGGTAQLHFDVSPPAWVRPGQWWALVRVACAGHLLYTPAVAVTVR